MLVLLLMLAASEAPSADEPTAAPLVEALPEAKLIPAQPVRDGSSGGARIGGALLGTLVGGTLSALLAGAAFLVGWASEGFNQQKLGGSLGLGGIVGGAGLLFLMPSAASWGHQSYGGKSTWQSGVLGFGIGASLASLLVIPALALYGQDPKLQTVLISISIPMPLIGMLSTLELKHRLELGL